MARKSVLFLIIVFWLPWLVARVLGRRREIVIRCDGGEGQTPAVSVETEKR
jgi:hypothetical protein